MTVKQFHDLFLQIADKTADPYFPHREIDRWGNLATLQWLESQLRPKDSENPFEVSLIGERDVSPLILPEIAVQTDAEGRVGYDIISVAMAAVAPAAVANAFTQNRYKILYRFLALSRKYVPVAVGPNTLNGGLRMFHGKTDANSASNVDNTFVPSDFIRHGDWLRLQGNNFKKPTDRYPRHRFFDTFVKFAPTGVQDIQLTMLRYPLPMDYDRNDPDELNDIDLEPGADAINPELSDEVMQQILALALRLAGVSLREGELIQGSELVKVQ